MGVREAEAFEAQMRGGQTRGPSVAPTAALPAAAAPGPPSSNGAPQNGGGADYSAQWAEYYRSIGKVKEAEAIEQQMRAKSQSQPPQQPLRKSRLPTSARPGRWILLRHIFVSA